MAKHLMIDMETMAVTPDTVILTLGAVHFDPFGDTIGNTLYLKLDIDDQDALKRSVDPNTLTWWSKQDIAIMEEAFSPEGRIKVVDAVDQFHKFAWGCKSFWSHGATFDLVIMDNLYRQLGRTPPWNYWQMRDTRTLFDLGHSPDMPTDGKHDALQDAIRQAVGVQNVYRKLGVKPK